MLGNYGKHSACLAGDYLILGLLFGGQGACPDPQALGVSFHLEAQQPQAAHSYNCHTHGNHPVGAPATIHSLQQLECACCSQSQTACTATKAAAGGDGAVLTERAEQVWEAHAKQSLVSHSPCHERREAQCGWFLWHTHHDNYS